jgi:hypothetical protein
VALKLFTTENPKFAILLYDFNIKPKDHSLPSYAITNVDILRCLDSDIQTMKPLRKSFLYRAHGFTIFSTLEMLRILLDVFMLSHLKKAVNGKLIYDRPREMI